MREPSLPPLASAFWTPFVAGLVDPGFMLGTASIKLFRIGTRGSSRHGRALGQGCRRAASTRSRAIILVLLYELSCRTCRFVLLDFVLCSRSDVSFAGRRRILCVSFG